MILLVGLLAVIQAIIQLTYFMNIGKEARPRLKLLTFSFMLIVIFILVGGSIWIMNNLNYHHMSAHQENTYLRQNEGI